MNRKKMLTTLLLALAISVCGDDIIYRTRFGIPMESSEILRRLDRFLGEIFLKSPYPRNELTIEINDSTPFKLRYEGKVLEINRAALDRKELSLLARAGGIILHARGKAPENFVLPYFLCGAFRHRERSRKNESRFLNSNRKARSVAALLREGATPDFKHLLSYLPETENSVEDQWFDDHSRILFELLRRSHFRGTVEDISEAAMKTASAAETGKNFTPLIWNNFTPIPPHIARRQLDEMFKVEIPPIPVKESESAPETQKQQSEKNKVSSKPSPALQAGKKKVPPKKSPAVQTGKKKESPGKTSSTASPAPPAGESVIVHVSEMPRQLMEHPLRGQVCRKYAFSLLSKGAGLPVPLRSALRQFHDAVLAFGRSPGKAPEFTAALRHVEKTFELCKARSEELDSMELFSEKLIPQYRLVIETNSADGDLLSPESARFLKRMEGIYSGN